MEDPVALRGKQREYLRREQEILDVAREMLSREGLVGLAMQRIADALGYATGTIYQHFSCKEEVTLALAIESGEKRLELYQRAVSFDGRPREKMVALGEVSSILYPRHFHSELIVYTNALRAKTSQERQEQLKEVEMRCFSIGLGTVLEALEVSDLVLPSKSSPETFFFMLSAMFFGAFGIMNTDAPLIEAGIDNPIPALRGFAKDVLDGFGWRPLSNEWDYRSTMKRIYTEVFPPDVIERIAKRTPVGNG